VQRSSQFLKYFIIVITFWNVGLLTLGKKWFLYIFEVWIKELYWNTINFNDIRYNFRHFWTYFCTLVWIKCIRGASLLKKIFCLLFPFFGLKNYLKPRIIVPLLIVLSIRTPAYSLDTEYRRWKVDQVLGVPICLYQNFKVTPFCRYPLMYGKRVICPTLFDLRDSFSRENNILPQ
jgi:hypothetical protein